jgi:hypothetical protein
VERAKDRVARTQLDSEWRRLLPDRRLGDGERRDQSPAEFDQDRLSGRCRRAVLLLLQPDRRTPLARPGRANRGFGHDPPGRFLDARPGGSSLRFPSPRRSPPRLRLPARAVGGRIRLHLPDAEMDASHRAGVRRVAGRDLRVLPDTQGPGVLRRHRRAQQGPRHRAPVQQRGGDGANAAALPMFHSGDRCPGQVVQEFGRGKLPTRPQKSDRMVESVGRRKESDVLPGARRTNAPQPSRHGHEVRGVYVGAQTAEQLPRGTEGSP